VPFVIGILFFIGHETIIRLTVIFSIATKEMNNYGERERRLFFYSKIRKLYSLRKEHLTVFLAMKQI
jgi:hypothetical protein